MAIALRKPRKRKPSKAELIAQMEKEALSPAQLRRLVKKYPAPQEWYDQADEQAKPAKPKTKQK